MVGRILAVRRNFSKEATRKNAAVELMLHIKNRRIQLVIPLTLVKMHNDAIFQNLTDSIKRNKSEEGKGMACRLQT